MVAISTRRSSAEAATSSRPIPIVPRPNLQRLAPRSVEATSGIIIGSVLGGTALLLVCLFLVLFPLWHRRHSITTSPKRTSPTPMPQPDQPRDSTVRPFTPRRLAIDTGPAALALPSSSSSRRWHLEKAAACVHTPSGHPAITTTMTTNSNNNNNNNTAIATSASNGIMYRGDMLGNTITNSTSASSSSREGRISNLPHLQRDSSNSSNNNNNSNNNDSNNSNGSGNGNSTRNRNSNVPPRDSLAASVSSAFAAEMSSLLESISLKSSYSSLRSGGLGVPPRVAQAWRRQGSGGGVRAMEGDGADGADGAGGAGGGAGDGAGSDNDDTRTVPAAP